MKRSLDSAVARYVDDEASSHDEAMVRAQSWEDPEFARAIEYLRETRIRASQVVLEETWNPERALNAVLRQGTENRPTRTLPKKRRGHRSPAWGHLALGLAILAVVAIPILRYWLPVDFGESVAGVVASGTARQYVTKNAERATIDLPDGSRVILAPASRLRYHVRADGGRMLDLEGQAYFNVTQSRTRPFTVSAGHTITNVLGTAFSVRAYPGDDLQQVAVAEGKVSLAGRTDATGQDSSIILLPGDVGRMASAGARGPVVDRTVRIVDAFGWMQGQMTFDHVTLRTLIRELERVYDLDVRLDDPSLGDRIVTAAFTEKSVTDLLNAITLAAELRWRKDGSVVVLSHR